MELSDSEHRSSFLARSNYIVGVMSLTASSDFCPHRYVTDSSFPPASGPDSAPYNLIDFIAVAQRLKISFLEDTWQATREVIGGGSSGSISQAFMNLHTSLAFKCVSDSQKWKRPEDVIFRALINEIIAFSHPSIVRHPRVLNLEGICWDIDTGEEGKDKIWPTLMFEKSQYGDVDFFLTRPAGRELSFKERVDLCMDIAWAISDMHMHGIVHGDIKPANALIFRSDRRYTAKVTDFGLSTRDAGTDHPVFVAGSWPWTAPELNRSYFTVAQTKKMDIFSYGMLVFWILFEKYFSGEVPLPAEVRQKKQFFEDEQQQSLNMTVLDQLKRSNELTLLAKQLIREEQGIDDDAVRAFESFFDKALSYDPEERINALALFFPFKEHHRKSPVDQAKLENHNFHPSQCKFELTLSATDFYTLDYRIRRCIRQLVEQRQLASPDTHTAFQLALCNYIGFGGPRNEESLNSALQYSGRKLAELENTLTSMKPYDRVDERYTGKIIRALEASGHVSSRSPTAQTLQGAVTAIRQELDDLESSLGRSSRFWLINAGKLAWMYEYLGRWRNAEELRKELVLIYKTLVSEEDRAMLRAKQDLAATYGQLGRHQEAQELQRQVVDSKTKSLGKTHAETLQSMSHLAFMYEGDEQWEQAKELEVYIVDERKKVLGEEHIDTLHSMDCLALIYHKQDLWAESRDLWLRVIEISKRALGGEHPHTLVHKGNLAKAYCDRKFLQEAKELQAQIVETSIIVFGERHIRTLRSMSELACTLETQGAHLEAESLLRKILALTGDSLKEEEFTWTVMDGLGSLLRRQGKYAEAVSIYQEVLMSVMKVLGKEHSYTTNCMRILARTFEEQEKHAEAELISRDVIARTRVTRTAPTSTLADLNELAKALYKQGRYEQAESIYRDIIAGRKDTSQEDPVTWNTMSNLALMISKQDRQGEAELLYREVLMHEETVLGKGHGNTLASMHNLAVNLTEQGKFVEAESSLKEVLVMKAGIKGKEHPSTLATANSLGVVLIERGKCNEAEKVLDRNLVLRKKVLGMEHEDTLISMRNLASALREQGKYIDAEYISREEIILSKKKFGENDGRFLVSMNNLAKIYICQERYAEAEKLLQVAVKRREKETGKINPGSLKMKSNLAEALSGQKKWVEAQQMHQDILASRLAVLGAKHPDTLRSMVNLSNTLSGQGKHQEALLKYEKACETYHDTLGSDHPDTLACEKHCAHSRRQVNEQTSLHFECENEGAESENKQGASRSELELTKMTQDGHL